MPADRPHARPPGLRETFADLGPTELASGVIAFLFAASGPVAILLSVGVRGGLGEAALSSWLFGAFCLNGLLSIAFCRRYRQPLVFFWTIPGAVLVGPALGHLSMHEVVGAYLATGVLMSALGLSGLIRRVMDAVPMPVVMGMVAGMFLRFGLDLVHAVHDDFSIAAPMVVAFFVLGAAPSLGRRIPPLIGALVVGVLAIAFLGRFDPESARGWALVTPVLHVPAFSLRAMVELVVPLAITVLFVQNAQGTAVLQAAGHHPPVNAITLACGDASLVTALVGTVSTCLTGPVNAILSSSGDPRRQYAAGIFVGLLAVGFGLAAPVFVRLLLAAPPAFVAALGGLAMLRVLQTAFATAFQDRFALSALVTFLVTVADVTLLGIGAAFWGLVLGFAASRLLERQEQGG